MLKKFLSLMLMGIFTSGLISVDTVAHSPNNNAESDQGVVELFKIPDTPSGIDEDTTLGEVIRNGTLGDLVIHMESNNRISMYSDNYDSLRVGNLNNVVVNVRFKGEDEFLIAEENGQPINEILDNLYNKSNISLKEYYKEISNNKLNISTTFAGIDTNNTQSIELSHERGYYRPYSSSNTDGYFEYALIDKDTGEFFANMYKRKSWGDDPVDLDPSDGIVTFEYLQENEDVISEETYLYGFIREMELMKEITEKVNDSEIVDLNLDKNGDNIIDALTIMVGVAEDRWFIQDLQWLELLWPHQNSVPQDITREDVEEIMYRYNLDYTFVLESEYKIANNYIDKYNLYTSAYILDPDFAGISDKGILGNSGTICHEFGHILNLPDFYNYKDQSDGCVGQWELMAMNMPIPQYINSYVRKEAGWLENDELPVIENDGEYELTPVSSATLGDIAGYIIQLPEYPEQEFFVEYRKSEGVFDGGEYYNGYVDINGKVIGENESGLVIYRVDSGVENSRNMLMAGNFEGYPYNLYVFRGADANSYDYTNSQAALNGTERTSFGRKDSNVIENAITFQGEDGLVNSRVVIDNVSVDEANNKIKFTIDVKDPSITKMEVKDNKIIIELDEKIEHGTDFSLIMLTKDGIDENINVEIIEDNKIVISLIEGELSGKYNISIPKDSVKDIVGKSLVYDYNNEISFDDIINVTEVVLDKSEVELNVGENISLTAIVNPEGATNKNVTWESNNTAIATVSENGNVIAISEGEAVITVRTEEGGKTASCKVVVKKVNESSIAVESIELDKSKIKLDVGEEMSLKATVTPENATNKNVVWNSDNESIVKVDSNGKVTAIGEGVAKIITTTVDGGKIATCIVTVTKIINDEEDNKKIKVTGVKLDKNNLSIKTGESFVLTATVTPNNATNKKIIWTSSDKSIATVDVNGKVVGIKEGSAVITVKTEDGGFMAKCNVNVTKKATTVTTPSNNNTTSDKVLPETGKENPVLIIGIIALFAGAIIKSRVKYI